MFDDRATTRSPFRHRLFALFPPLTLTGSSLSSTLRQPTSVEHLKGIQRLPDKDQSPSAESGLADKASPVIDPYAPGAQATTQVISATQRRWQLRDEQSKRPLLNQSHTTTHDT